MKDHYGTYLLKPTAKTKLREWIGKDIKQAARDVELNELLSEIDDTGKAKIVFQHVCGSIVKITIGDIVIR